MREQNSIPTLTQDDGGLMAQRAVLGWLCGKLQLASYVVASVLRRGLWRTLKIVWFEFLYERKFGGSTGRIIPVADLDGDGDAAVHASACFPSSFLVLHEAFGAGAIECEDRVLVDFGCGLGRAMMFFSDLPLREIIGVEFSATLCAETTRNLERLYARRDKKIPRWRVINCDARTFEIPSEATIFYLFNPFDAVVLGTVIDNIIASVADIPRQCTVVYANPIHAGAFVSRGLLATPHAARDFLVFSLGHEPVASAPRITSSD